MTKLFISLALVGWLVVARGSGANNKVTIYQAPDGESLNTQYKVTADGQNVPVYINKVGMKRRANRERAMDDQPNSHLFYDIAGFASFDIKQGPVEVAVSINEKIKIAKILPTSFGIIPEVHGNTLSFKIDKPKNVVVEINGEHIRSLHIFANPEETNIPDPHDSHVIYFAPGIHNLYSSVVVPDGTTVYVAGGAVLRCFNDNAPTPAQEEGNDSQRQCFVLSGNNITFRGRGIIDQENVDRMKPRQMISITGNDVNMEGVILRNSCVWTVSLRGANRVKIDNIKLLGHRANSDGIDICDSWNVLVENCFIRTLDDLIVVKTYDRENGSGNILARKCVLWNEVAHALSIGAEIRQVVDGVTFTDCDIIGDHCREWSLRVYQCDRGVVKNVTFDDIRIEESVKFASLWINKATWSTDPERGHIENIIFKNITVNNPTPLVKGMELLGFDKEHAIKDVRVENVVVQGKKITRDDVMANDYVNNLTVQ